jgi:hypothetical protein
MSRTLAVILVATMVARSTAPSAAGERDSTTSEVQSAPAQVDLTPQGGQAPDGSRTIAAGLEVRAAHPEGETRKLDLNNVKPATQGRPAALTTLYVSFGLLSGLDFYTTLRGTRAGATEGNPVMAPIAGNPAALLAVRAGGSAAAIYFAERLRKRNRAAAIAAMAVTNGVLAAIVAHNARVLGRAGERPR